MTESQKIYDQRGQTVYGNQTNVAGDQHIHLSPIEPSAAVAPAPPTDFVGREDQLVQLTAMLRAGKSAAITALHGMGGVGKTALAQEVAERLKPDFPGGIFWGDLALHGGSAETVLRTWGAICGADFSQEPDPAVLSQRLRGLLAMRRETNGALLAVVDDVRREWLDAAKLLQKSLPAGTPLLVTMRDVDLAVALDAEVVRLDVLPEPDAYKMLAARVKPREILTPEETVKALLDHLGYLPLAIRLAAGYVSKFAAKPGFALGQFVDDVAQRAVSLLDAAGGAGLAATFAISYDALSAEQQRVFRYCSVYSAPLLTVEHIAGLLGIDEAAVEAVLDDLVEAALLEWDREVKGRYVLHPLLRQYGYDRLQQEENAVLLHRQAAIYLYSGIGRMGRLPDEVLEEVRQWQLAHEWELMARRAHRLIGTLDRYGYWDEIEVVLHSAQDSLSNVANHINSAWLLLSARGSIANNKAQFDKALDFYTKAQAVMEGTSEAEHLCKIYVLMGNAYRRKGNPDEAIEYYSKALEFGKLRTDKELTANALMNLANVLGIDSAKYDEASNLYQEALAIFQELDDTQGIANVYGNLGGLCLRRQETSQGIQYLESSIELKQQLGDLRGLADSCGNLGSAYLQADRNEAALNMHVLAGGIYSQLGDLYGLTTTFLNIGSVKAKLQENQQAIDSYNQALQIAQSIGNPGMVGKAYEGLGFIYERMADWRRATEIYEQAVISFERGRRLEDVANMYARLGDIHLENGNTPDAITYYDHATTAYAKLDDIFNRRRTLAELYHIYFEKEDWDNVARTTEPLLEIAKQLSDTSAIAELSVAMGAYHMERGIARNAIPYFEQALDTYRQIKGDERIAQALLDLGISHLRSDGEDQAILYLAEALELCSNTDDLTQLGHVYNNLGLAYSQKGELQNAINSYSLSLDLKKQQEDLQGIADVLANMGVAYRDAEQWDDAIAHFKKAVVLYNQLEDYGPLASTLAETGTLLQHFGDPKEARAYLAQAWLIFRHLKDTASQNQLIQQLIQLLDTPENVLAYLNQGMGKGGFLPDVNG